MSSTPYRLAPDSPALPQVLAVMQEAFASMEGRIDPPSSLHRLTLADLVSQAETKEIWCIGAPPQACVILTASDDAIYIGKLAVAVSRRGTGLGRRLVDLAAERARALGLSALELQVRVELVENHVAFARMGFATTERTAHPGYDRATSLTMRRPVSPRI
ncbi:N-acetyltransferase [Phaeobacter sp. B1627]|uniref:GNAT family N-acetyltransferase n=1 Tax=Phaeobacter sp. B1627 TaxID=2583809 RepID=UPI00111B0D8C|nr:GNAT family N-acetyltransferase [Phaeobacter sp. B1627]TNJ48589.1 GNAT family N-acetyltransferase [Phaeobacter sp. B1627]